MIDIIKNFKFTDLLFTDPFPKISPVTLKVVSAAAILGGGMYGVYWWVDKQLQALGRALYVEYFERPFSARQSEEFTSFDWNRAFDTAELKDLRAAAGLDPVIAGSNTTYEQVLAIAAFVHKLWRHDGSHDPGTENPVEIIQRAQAGEKFRCVEYSRVLSASLRSMGIPARVLALKMKDCETISTGAGHVVVEAFVDNRWIMIDPQENFIPCLRGVPLSALEFGRHLQTFGKQNIENGTGDVDPGGYLDQYLSWIKPYLYYMDTFVTPSEESKRRVMLIPEGALIPKIFQRTIVLDNYSYTGDAASFYARPVTKLA